MTTIARATTTIAALLVLAGCPIAASDLGAFGAPCAATCAEGFTCDAASGVCVPARSEGEGEGEGARAGEGEGEGARGAEGEGEGSSGEGEGEGGPSDGTCPDNVCECPNAGDVCFFGECAAHFAVCAQDADCGREDPCDPAAPLSFACDAGTKLCSGRPPNLVVTVRWSGPAELITHVIKKDAIGAYCVDTTNVDSNAQVGPAASRCSNDPQLDCDYDCGLGAVPEGFIHWGPGDDARPAFVEVEDSSDNWVDVISAYGAPAGDYLVAAYFFDDGNGIEDSLTLDLVIDDGHGTTALHVSKPIANLHTWLELAHVRVDATGAIACVADLTTSPATCGP